jgi:hypothetical protein
MTAGFRRRLQFAGDGAGYHNNERHDGHFFGQISAVVQHKSASQVHESCNALLEYGCDAEARDIGGSCAAKTPSDGVRWYSAISRRAAEALVAAATTGVPAQSRFTLTS